MEIARNDIKEKLSTIPARPGCYKYKDAKGEIIYVGKAKNLSRRISSYFQKIPTDTKTRALLQAFSTVEYIVVETEHDALLLEYNLIREFRPKYNVLLKEGNAYPLICIKNESFPRVFATHKPEEDGSRYYGPYPNRSMAWTLIQLFRSIYKLRTCSLNLTPENIRARKFRVCLQYHIKRCKAPCVGKITEDEYNEYIQDIEEILEGNVRELVAKLSERMKAEAEEWRFEEAQTCKEIIERLENFQGRSLISSTSLSRAIVVSFGGDTEAIYVNYLEIHQGNVIAGRTLEYRRGVEEEEGEVRSSILLEILNSTRHDVREVILSERLEFPLPGRYAVVIPKRGEKKKLVELSLENVRQYQEDKYRQAEKLNPEQRNIQLLQELQNKIGLPTLPYHIECFDNSNISGEYAVAACIVFKGAKPSKADYRHFHIRTVEGPDDYASMREVVTRRYEAVLEKEESLPDLLIVDGGKAHMACVREALDALALQIPIVGLAKDSKHRTANILFGNPPEVIGIMSRSPAFRLLEKIQDEVHRFAITFHRKVRSKKQVDSFLDHVPGVGVQTKKKLLQHFRSVNKIKEADLQELADVIGKARAEKLINYIKENA